MRNIFVIFIVCFFAYTNSLAQEKLTPFVNPFLGTGGHADISPGAVVPYGEVQLTPYSGKSEIAMSSRYHFDSKKIFGFNHVYLSEGAKRNWLDISVMPLIAPLKGQDTIFTAATFSHQREAAVPGYYWVELDNKIRIELTATDRLGYQRYTFPAGSEPTIRFNLAAQDRNDAAYETFIQKENDSTLVGYRYITGPVDSGKVYFAARTSKRILEFRLKGEMDIEAGDINIGLKSDKDEEGLTSQLIFSHTSVPETIELKVALSVISSEDALEKLEEIPHWNFNMVKEQANADWENELAKIRITSPDGELKKIFYTALYHTAIAPQSVSSNRAGSVLPSMVVDSANIAIFPASPNRERARRMMDSLFQEGLEGYKGEAGVRPMSVWAVWNILGFYDVNREKGEYYIGSPMVDMALIDVNNGNKFEIEVLNNTPQNKYVRSLKLNGANYKKEYLLNADLIKGGKLTVIMGAEPTMKREEDQESTNSAKKKDVFKSIGDFFKNLFK